MTSNLGSEALSQLADYAAEDAEKQRVLDAVKAHFRPEFLNRLDEIVVFDRLSRQDMAGIVDIQLNRLEERLSRRGLALAVDHAARNWLADAGYDPVYGARPLKRVLQKHLQNRLAEALLDGSIKDGDTIRVSAGGSLGLTINEIGESAAPTQPVTLH